MAHANDGIIYSHYNYVVEHIVQDNSNFVKKKKVCKKKTKDWKDIHQKE